jgi:iron-sulfur cluster repair protein YtfE (RIC family)
MKQTDRFHKQHNELLELAKKIDELLVPEQLANDATEVRRCLSDLVGKLRMHLAAEDNALYPSLLKHENEEVKAIAQQFIDEMGNIGAVLASYLEKWSSHLPIQDNPMDFIKETRGIFSALADRIEKEDNKLFPLLDKS